MSKQTNYAGIDYGLGKTNRDPNTGIRYGVIGQNALNPDALQEVFDQGKNLDFENWQGEVKKQLRSAISDYFSDYVHSGTKESRLDQAVESAFSALEDCGLNDQYEENSDKYAYDRDGLKIETSDQDLFVTLSPFYTYAQFCSPCAPGACHLENPLNVEGVVYWSKELRDKYAGNRCYCLGHDWFDDGKAPYRIFSVETGEEIETEGDK